MSANEQLPTHRPTLSPKAVAIVVAALVALSAAAVRWIGSSFQELPGEQRQLCVDPDSLYHMRRLERALEEGLPVAGEDPFLNFPRGSAIPWPPYYTYVLYGILAPWTPAAEEGREARHAFLELNVARIPVVFGVLTALLAAWAAGLLAGPRAALLAGLLQAFTLGSIQYSRQGNGDHHAFVSLLLTGVMLALARGLQRGVLEDRRRSAWSGAVVGALVGLALGVWVGALMYVLVLQLVLAWLLFLNARRELPGLPALGIALHGTATLVLLPAVLDSPWRQDWPWMVVNLSWFHLVHLTLGALVFFPLLWLNRGGTSWRRYPWILGVVLALLGALIWLLPVGPGLGIREGFEWVSRENRFMATIRESMPLFGEDAEPGAFVRYLGWTAWAAPLAWLGAAVRCIRRRELALIPWVVAFPPLFVQALLQRRFADPLSPLLAVLVAWGVVECARGLANSSRGRWTSSRRVAALTWLSVPVLAILSHGSAVVLPVIRESLREGTARRTPAEIRSLGMHRMHRWLRKNSPDRADYGVLANWGMGHSIEWTAERPTLATNFGTYVGPEGFRSALNFLLAEDEAQAEAILERERARYIIVGCDWSHRAAKQVAKVFPERSSRYFMGSESQAVHIQPAWLSTMGARAMFGGRRPTGIGVLKEPHFEFLRLVHVSPVPDPAPALSQESGPAASGWIWEHVPGALLTSHGTPGEELVVDIPLRYPRAKYELRFENRAEVGADGQVRLRVPYSTLERNGDGLVRGQASWKLGGRSGLLSVSERDVLEGREVTLP